MFGPPDWRKDTTDRSGIMRKFWSAVLVLAVAGIIGVGSAFAADPPKKERKKGERPSLEQIFKKLDTTADDNLTAAEFATSPRLKGDEAKAKEILAKMDGDKDGKVTCKEFCDHIKKMHAGHHKKDDAKKGDAKRPEHKKGGAKKGDHHKKGGHQDGAKKRGDKKPECKK